jgi:acetaldehyde dehydrogenase
VTIPSGEISVRARVDSAWPIPNCGCNKKPHENKGEDRMTTDAKAPRLKVAIIGSGNIGADLMIKIMRTSRNLELAAFVGIDPESDGLKRAAGLGIATTADGISGLTKMPSWPEIGLVFDATSAAAHKTNNDICAAAGKILIDLTPAAIGPYVIPVVNGDAHLESANVNMVTCGGQATIPIVAAVSQVATVHYAEIVSSIASKSAGPGTRANIDEFTQTTARGIEAVGGAAKGKAIIILNPAEPPVMMRGTVFTLSSGATEDAIAASVGAMVEKIQAYGIKTSVFLEVEGAAHYLPAYAGNLDIMTSAALATAEKIATGQLAKRLVA